MTQEPYKLVAFRATTIQHTRIYRKLAPHVPERKREEREFNYHKHAQGTNTQKSKQTASYPKHPYFASTSSQSQTIHSPLLISSTIPTIQALTITTGNSEYGHSLSTTFNIPVEK